MSKEFPRVERLIGWYSNFAVYILNTLLLLFCVELAAEVVLWSYTHYVKQDPRPKLTIYQEEPWNETYWFELDKATQGAYYQDYIGWRTKPYQGEYVQVNQNGLRVTPSADCSLEAFKVFMFGGSTMWGVGAPDSGTIPSYFQKLLSNRRSEQPICVVNFGILAGVSTQGVIQLQEELKRGNIPDWVIFYDGANDVIAAYQSGRAGSVQFSNMIKDRFEGTEPLAFRLHRSFASFKILASLAQKIKGGQPFVWTYLRPGVYNDTLATEVATIYLQNQKMVSVLAETYGFTDYFFWQPLVFTGNKPLTPEEKGYIDSLDPGLITLYNKVYPIIADAALERANLYYIVNVFDNETEQVFIDYVHISPHGNKRIAEEMFASIGHSMTKE